MKLPNPLTYDALVDTGIFLKNHIVGETNAPFDGLMFETYGAELDFVLEVAGKHPQRVATLLDCDGRTYLASGYHLVNRLGYFVSSVDLPEIEGLAVDEDEMEQHNAVSLEKRSAEYPIAVASLHGNDSEPEMETGDLQVFFREAFALLTPEQRGQFYRTDAVRDALAAGLGVDREEFNSSNPTV